jgi:DNA polymerase III delta prime subunit
MPGLSELVIHPASKNILERLQNNQPQSLLLSGPKGIGLRQIATHLFNAPIAAVLSPQDSKEQPDENGTITVETVRRLYEQTRAVHTKQQVIVIDDADRMSKGAQSAFLKLLEEPGAHTLFILTSHHPDTLLSTILSRVQHTVIRPATTEQTKRLMEQLKISDAKKQTQLQYIADGLPAEIIRLVTDEKLFTMRAGYIGDARQLLQGDAYQKAIIIQKYRSDRAATLRLVDSAIAILRRTVSLKPQQSLIGQLEQLLEIREHIASNYNPSLQLMQFVL